MNRLIGKIVGMLGYEIRRQISCDERDDLHLLIRTVRPYTMLSDARLASIYDQVMHLERNRIAGCFVECGAWRGGCAGLMALVNLRYGEAPRALHLFDSFEGIPEPDAAVDGERAVLEAERFGMKPSGRLIPNPQFYENMGRAVGRLEDCKHLLETVVCYPPGYIHYHKGFFQETVPAVSPEIGEIALLHLDGDWYDSTKVCLDGLYDLVTPGGLVTIDDYGAYDGCRKAVDDFFGSRGEPAPYMHRVDTEVRVFAKP